MSHNTVSVEVQIPERLMEQAEALAMVLAEEREDIVVTALREYLHNATHDDTLAQEIAAAYYDEQISWEQLKALLGAEEAANFHVLKQQLEEEFINTISES